jgi:MmeI, target recognition domain
MAWGSLRDGIPADLAANSGKAFIGSYILGMGFTFDDQAAAKGSASTISEMRRLIEEAPTSAGRIFPYIGGEELNNSPTHAHHRYVFNLSDLDEGTARAHFPRLMTIAELLVKPQRKGLKREVYRDRWWRFAEPQNALYAGIKSKPFVLAATRVSPHVAIARLPAGMVYSEQLVVFIDGSLANFALVQARSHDLWARFFSSSLGETLRYVPTDCFETFPFPLLQNTPVIESVGQIYYNSRAALMIERNEGMTKTYNRFHDRNETAADIVRLRELHAAMDRAVLGGYGWHDLAERAEPIFLDETNEDDHTYQGRLFWPAAFRDEVLARLLALNTERHAEEVRLGIAPGMKMKSASDDDEIENN